MAQVSVTDKRHEVSKANDRLAGRVWQGQGITADAMLTQRAMSQPIGDSGGQDFLVVKKPR
jgi:hypothetical protein